MQQGKLTMRDPLSKRAAKLDPNFVMRNTTSRKFHSQRKKYAKAARSGFETLL